MKLLEENYQMSKPELMNLGTMLAEFNTQSNDEIKWPHKTKPE